MSATNLKEPHSRGLPDSTSFLSVITDYLIGGVDLNLAGNGGAGCPTFRSPQRKIIETVLVGGLSILAYKTAQKKIKSSTETRSGSHHQLFTGRQLVLIAITIMFGIQVGFKIGSKTVIWLLQPCHMLTALQIFLLAVPNHKYTSFLYRVHLGMLCGPILALLFPVTSTLIFPFEVELYWIQHLVLPAFPFYLNLLGEPYTIDFANKGSWILMSYAAFLFYHMVILQPIAILLGINVSTTLCPAPTDPFFGPNYLLHAVWHQAVCVAVVAVAYTYILSNTKLQDVKQQQQ